MSNTIQIAFSKHVDREIIEAPTNYFVDVVDNFLNNTTTALDINALGTDEKEAFKKVIDVCTYLAEGDCYIWKVELTSKTFSLNKSVYRTTEDTTTEVEMTVGTPIKVTFETPGFTSYNTYNISLWYDQDFLTIDIDALADMGIVLTGNGKEFTISNAVECKVSFTKPDSVTDVYVVLNEFNNQIIPV